MNLTGKRSRHGTAGSVTQPVPAPPTGEDHRVNGTKAGELAHAVLKATSGDKGPHKVRSGLAIWTPATQ